ncbi:hypothetical protein ACQUQU_15665 [Thalassolituus sp. LLYu03]|uniref:hypothetical protein n=1 Tax=Thalassolituus sp. LLYu03 TaxID=3421656 RepID=UPI003D270AD0
MINTDRKRHDMVNVQMPAQESSSALQVLVIRTNSLGIGYEVASCSGGFNSLTISKDHLSSTQFVGNRTGRNRISTSYSGSRQVSLSRLASYQEDVEQTVEFRRVSDSVNPFGTWKLNWSDTEGDSSVGVTCAVIENRNDDRQAVVVAAADGSRMQLTDYIPVDSYTAFIVQAGHDDGIVNLLTYGSQNYTISSQSDQALSYTYNATSSDGLSIAGNVSLKLIP